MPLVFVLGHVGTLDALLAVHVLAVVALDLTATERTGAYRAAATGALLGLAFLIKGPVGIVLPLLVILAGRTVLGRNLLPSLGALSQGLAAWCLVVLPWGLAFLRRVGADAVLSTVRSEALERFFAGTAHVEPAWYYGKIVLVAFLPWLAPLLVALVRAWRMRREPVARTAIYAAAGLLAGLLFFSLSKGKLPNYVLPLAPLAAILITWELGREIEAPRQRTLGPTLLAATVAAMALLLGLTGTLRLEGTWRGVALAGAAIYGVGTVASFYGAIARKPRWVYGSAALSMALLLLLVAIQGFPAVGETRSTASLIEKVAELSSGRPVVTVEMRAPSLTFYLDRSVEVIGMRDLEARIGREDAATYVFAEPDLPDLPPIAGERLREVGGQAKFRVFVAGPPEPENAPPAGPNRLDVPPGEK
jgi:4-amino-4-deoxy-L-arabinose transferase-like glycosyltransferase